MAALSGIAVSRGISIAPVFQFRTASLAFDSYRPDDPQAEWARFQAGVEAARCKLEKIYEQAVAEIGTDEAAIFHAHIAILQDPDLHDGIQEKILNDGLNAEAALFQVSQGYQHMLEELDDEYLKARALDVRDVTNSLLKTLLGVADAPGEGLVAPSIVVSRELTPSDCISLNRKLILGFCTLEGGATSHTAILARSLGVPAIVGVPESVLDLAEGEIAILDGSTGRLITAPDEAALQKYEALRAAQTQSLDEAKAAAHLPALTLDGEQVLVYANIGGDSPEDLQSAVKNGAEGVGLLRTEFIYLDCREMPDEELQYRKYRAVAEAFGERTVILRTLDIGGDKQLPYLNLPYELNPFLGVRGLRLCLRNPELFKTQLRAVLRAAAAGKLHLMFPMVTKVSEIRTAREILETCRKELVAEGRAAPAKLEVGIMIEIPAAALLAHHLAREVDFFSIGTNDLSQYTLAVDRTNTNLTDLANAYDPAVLRLIQMVVKAAHACGKPVGVCGELAGEPLAIPILLGLEVDELSMNPPAIPAAKQLIRRLSKTEMRKLAAAVLELETPAEVKTFISQQLPFLKGLI